MKIFNLAEMGDNMEEVFDIKKDIETQMKERGEITEKLSLVNFFTKICTQTNIFFKGNTVIPYIIIEGKEDKYLIYTDNDRNKDVFDVMYKKLEHVKFNTMNLTKLSLDQLMLEKLDEGEYFIVNGQYYA